MRDIDIHELFHIINNERTCIGEDRVMPRSQPDFKVCERTVPVKYLDDEGKDEAEDMKDLYSLIFNSPERTQKEKDDPEEMDQDNDICRDFVEHCIQPTRPKTRKYGRSFKETMIRLMLKRRRMRKSVSVARVNRRQGMESPTAFFPQHSSPSSHASIFPQHNT